MPRTYVALDLETTGLNPDKDAIIEVGAVKFRDGEIVEEFTTLVNPGRPIPPEITMITRITDRYVLDAPLFERIEAPLLRFVGQAPVVGHNVSFDLGFMRSRPAAGNIGLDTWELATIVLPSQPGYSLGALAERFGLALPNAHRARTMRTPRAGSSSCCALRRAGSRAPSSWRSPGWPMAATGPWPRCSARR